MREIPQCFEGCSGAAVGAVVAVLVPAVVLGVLAGFGAPLAIALAPFLLLVGFSPFMFRRRIDASPQSASTGCGISSTRGNDPMTR